VQKSLSALSKDLFSTSGDFVRNSQSSSFDAVKRGTIDVLHYYVSFTASIRFVKIRALRNSEDDGNIPNGTHR
jgi:hypothetical protein